MDNPQQHYEAMRKRVMWTLVLRVSFVFNILFYILIILLLREDLKTSTSAEDVLGALLFVLIWGGGLLVHAASAFNLLGWATDRIVRREIVRNGQDISEEKPKRQAMRLGDDGELLEVDEVNELHSQKVKNG
jgi:hypothetical protein